jgi:hypothetical protein
MGSVVVAILLPAGREVGAELRGRQHFREESVEGGEIGGLDTLRRDRHAVERQRARRAGVLGEQALEAEIGRRARGRVDAHVGHHPGNDELGDRVRAQVLEQRRLAEAVREMLPEDGLPGSRANRFVDLHAGGVRQEERRAGPRGDVLDVHDRARRLAKRCEQACCLRRRRLGADDLHGAPRKVVVLDVDDQQRGGHESLSVNFRSCA